MIVNLVDKESEEILQVFENVIEFTEDFIISLIDDNRSIYWRLDNEIFILKVEDDGKIDRQD